MVIYTLSEKYTFGSKIKSTWYHSQKKGEWQQDLIILQFYACFKRQSGAVKIQLLQLWLQPEHRRVWMPQHGSQHRAGNSFLLVITPPFSKKANTAIYICNCSRDKKKKKSIWAASLNCPWLSRGFRAWDRLGLLWFCWFRWGRIRTQSALLLPVSWQKIMDSSFYVWPEGVVHFGVNNLGDDPVHTGLQHTRS